MARIPYPDITRPDLAPLAERVKRERGGKVLNIFKMLMHSGPALNGFLDFFTAVRQRFSLGDRHRELAIVQVALLNKAAYEVHHHLPLLRNAGVTDAQVESLKRGEIDATFTPTDKAVIAYATAMTRSVQVPDAVFAEVKAHFDERGIVELTVTIAGYNLVSRLLEALQVDRETGS